MEKQLKKVTVTEVKPLEKANYVPTQLVVATVEGQDELKYWEMIDGHDSVHVLIVNNETEEIIMVEQVRIPVLVKDRSQEGHVFEMCAGLVDKDANINQIVKEEILEECGYDVPLENIQHLKTLKSSVGTSGSNSYTYTAVVDESMRVSEGGGLPEEDINVVRIKFDDVFNFAFESDKHTDAVTMFMLTYWMMTDMADTGIEI